eukprot:s1_g2022.t1
MPITVTLDVMLAKRKMRSKDLAARIGITEANLSLLKSGKVKGVRFETLAAICEEEKMRAKHIQYLLASIFLGLGGWCLIAPHMVETLGFRPEYQMLNTTSALLIGCFGAQAVLAGTVIAISEFRQNTFLVFGLIGSVPFFIFNYYFYYVAEVFTDWMLLDFVGNIGILTCGLIGYRLKKAESQGLLQAA